MAFSIAQTFFLDPSTVKGATECGITRIDLYFKSKPKEAGNKSGITSPGVEVSIVPCVFGVPNISETTTIRPNEPTEHGARFQGRFETARVDYGDIQTSSDASVATIFKFEHPIFLDTGYEYAVIIAYDGSEDYILWDCRKGDTLVGTNIICPGPSGKFIGNLYHYLFPVDPIPPPQPLPAVTPGVNTANNNTSGLNGPSLEYLISNWKPVPDVDIKFRIFVARYFLNGVPIYSDAAVVNDQTLTGYRPPVLPAVAANNTFQITAPQRTMEYVSFDPRESNLEGLFFGEKVFQVNPYWPGNSVISGTPNPLTVSVISSNTIIPFVIFPGMPSPYLTVTANSDFRIKPTDATFAASNGWNNIYPAPTNQDCYIIIDNGDQVALRKVVAVYSNTQLIVDQPFPFVNTAAKFWVSPVAHIWGTDQTFFNDELRHFISLVDSNANDTVRFVNYRIESVNVISGGVNYSNSDYVVFGNTLNTTGFEYWSNEFEGGYAATANLVTNSSGGIQAVYMSNLGCHFTNSSWLVGANVHFYKPDGSTSDGSGYQFNYNIGSTFRTEFNPNNQIANAEVINLSVSRVKPEITVNNPLGTAFTIKHRMQYYVEPSSHTQSGEQYRMHVDPSATDIDVKIFKSGSFLPEIPAVLTSRSNEPLIRKDDNSQTTQLERGIGHSNSSVYLFEATSNNDFMAPFFEPEIINAHYSRYIINNDDTAENTNYGYAIAKHIGTKVIFSADRLAEDLVVYLTAYRPAGTNIKVYARIHNTQDPDAFDDKDWSMMQLTDGVDLYSSVQDTSDFKEFTYHFAPPGQAYGGSTVLDGTINIATSGLAGETNNQIAGSGTKFTNNISNGDVVKIRSGLVGFDGNTYMVAIVNTVYSDTLLDLTTFVSNNSFLDTNLIIEKVNYPKQAFKNIQNENVVRYYNTDLVAFDGYNTFQLKIVMLSNSQHIVPKIDDIRGVGVSA